MRFNAWPAKINDDETGPKRQSTKANNEYMLYLFERNR